MATSIGSISSAGLGSGLDVNSIITQLMAVEKTPLTLLQDQATDLNAKLSSFGKLQSNFSTMRDKANALISPTLWSGTTATSSDTSVAKVSTSSTASVGSYALEVSRLATGQSVTSSTLASSSATLSAGTLTIELGTWTGGTEANGWTPSGFDAKSGASAVSIDIADGATSLSAIRDKINAAGAGVVASIVNDASGARLSIRSKDTGAENAFRITATEAVDDGDAATGLSALAYDPLAGNSAMTRTTRAGNAEATINGIAVSSSSNTLTNVIDGLTVTLQKTTAANTPTQIDVTADTASIKTAITDFVSAFNTVASYIRTQTAYNAESKTGGTLQGDQGTLAIQNQLRAVLNQGSTASSKYSRLSDIGISMKSDGTLEVSTTKLDNALAGDLGELKKLFATDGSDTESSGFVRRFKRLADAALGAEGTFETRTNSIKTNVTRNSKSQEAMQLRLDQTEARLRKQYTALDTTMSKLNTLGNYVTQQVNKWNSSS